MEQRTLRPTVPAAEAILGKYFPVLDNGFIALKDYMGCDEGIEEAARLSYQGGTRQTSETRGLVRYLRRLRHTSPSEMAELKFHVSMPIFVARQWVRHRTASLNEVSARYSLLPMIFYTPKKENFLPQAKNNKQGREDGASFEDEGLYERTVIEWNNERKRSSGLYENLAADGVARELARIDLPLSTYTQWYWKVDLHNLLHFLTLRADEHAQWEIRQYANVIVGMVKRLAPLTYQAWIDYEHMSARFSRMEMEVLQELVSVLTQEEDGQAGVDTAAGSPTSGNFISHEELVKRIGSKREVQEFYAKLTKRYVRPGFDISEADAKPPEWFEERMANATPKIDAAPKGVAT